MTERNGFILTTQEFRDYLNKGRTVIGGSDIHLKMHELSQEALRITSEINGSYHTPEELRKLFSELTDSEIPDDFGLFPPFHTDCGKNIHIGKRVFINSGCSFQDQGGIYIDDGALIGHNATLVTLNHAEDLAHRADMDPKPIHIGKNVWLGSNVTVLPGVSIGDGAIVAAGAVVTKNVDSDTVVAGVPAHVVRKVKHSDD